MSEQSAIVIDGDSMTLGHLLDAVTYSTRPLPKTWSDVQRVLDLGTRYQFDPLPQIIAPRIDPARFAGDDPWFIFRFASRYRFTALARDAVAHLGGSWNWDRVTFDGLAVSLFSAIPAEYAVALVKALGRRHIQDSRDKTGVTDWVRVAQHFHLP